MNLYRYILIVRMEFNLHEKSRINENSGLNKYFILPVSVMSQLDLCYEETALSKGKKFTKIKLRLSI